MRSTSVVLFSLLFASIWASSLLCVGCDRRDSQERDAPRRIIVFAAASTADVLRDAGRRFEAAEGVGVDFSFDASSNLARQIKAGSPADLFVSADQRWMDDVAAAGAIRRDTRHDLLGNTLVMVAPSVRPLQIELRSDFGITRELPQVRRIAVGDPAHVPAGRYARQALESLGWWTALEPLLISAPDVRAALRLVELGEVDAGIVYATDAAISPRVVMVASFPADSHDPIRYPVALCTESADAELFLRFLQSTEMVEVFERAGFGVGFEAGFDARSEAGTEAGHDPGARPKAAHP